MPDSPSVFCLEHDSFVGHKHCKVAPLCTVPAGETLEDYTVVFGNNQRRKAQPGLEVHRKIAHDKEVQVLKKLIPTNLTKWQSSTR